MCLYVKNYEQNGIKANTTEQNDMANLSLLSVFVMFYAHRVAGREERKHTSVWPSRTDTMYPTGNDPIRRVSSRERVVGVFCAMLHITFRAPV